MSRTYRATAINLKAMPIGETDRLLTLLTPELGVLRVTAPGARKHLSQLGGRSGLFVINDVLIAKGKRLDKLVQAETLRSFPGLSQHLGKLTASQYLAELVLLQALDEQPQPDLYYLFVEHLERIEASSQSGILACLTHGIYHLLALEGVAPDFQTCCVTRRPVVPDLSNPDWRIGFSVAAGGIFQLSELGRLASGRAAGVYTQSSVVDSASKHSVRSHRVQEVESAASSQKAIAVTQLTALELALLQQLSRADLVTTAQGLASPVGSGVRQPHELWMRIERLLRQYAQYQFDQPIRSAALIDTCFSSK
ncbi:DNA repair protein RecO [Pseudanabaena sp. FACHB-2040]|nr:DNA repair protein RecO [Pseudanabaena sp. FACHB-2040]